ncbi:MAG: amidohydrolase family protein [Chloroflexi bacterium]|nr:amidohydrolase family protein [Chloroflexota bacterium]
MTTHATDATHTTGAANPAGVLPWSSARIPRAPQPGPGGLVDANSFLGEWPARRLNGSPPPARDALVAQRLRLMDKLGIRRAAVAILDGVLLKDAHVANAELHLLIHDHLARFFPVYTLNPTFPDSAEQVARCRLDYGLAPGTGAVRLHSGFQRYALDDARLAAALRQLRRLDLPVVVTLQLEDSRIHHPAIQVPNPEPAVVADLVNRWPDVRWILAGGRYREVEAIGTRLWRDARVWFDIARVQGPMDCIRSLRETIGVHRLLFGTNLPFILAESPVMELGDARLSEAEDADVRYRNATAALGIT